MVNKEVLNRKIQLQRTKNLMKQIIGIRVLTYDDAISTTLLYEMGYYDSLKRPDSMISLTSSEHDLIAWINELVEINDDDTCYILCGMYMAKILVLEKSSMLSDLWKCSHCISILNNEQTMIYEIGCDSRDEYNYLFDKYSLI